MLFQHPLFGVGYHTVFLYGGTHTLKKKTPLSLLSVSRFLSLLVSSALSPALSLRRSSLSALSQCSLSAHGRALSQRAVADLPHDTAARLRLLLPLLDVAAPVPPVSSLARRGSIRIWDDKFGGAEAQKGIGKKKKEEEERMEEAIVLYPAMGIGHILSMVQLAKHILQHSSAAGHCFKITVLLTTGLMDHPSIDSYIHRISFSHPSISFLRFPFLAPTHSNSLTATGLKFLADNAPNVASALSCISQSSSIKAFIIDLFCTSAMSAASALGIPVYYFFTSGAAVLSLYSYYPTIHNCNNPCNFGPLKG